MELKKPLEYDEQVDRLIAHGMIIDDKEEAIETLKMINYYRFSGYALQYRINPQDSTYKEGTTAACLRFIRSMRDVLRIIFILSGRIRSCIGRAILRRNSITF